MQNKEEESHAGLKLGFIFLYLFMLGILPFLDNKSIIEMNLDNPNTMAVLKILQAFTVLIFFILPSILFALYWTKVKINYLGLFTKPSLKTLIISGTGMLMALPMINWLAEINLQMHLPEALSGIEEWMRNSEEKLTVLTEALTRGDTFGILILNLFVIAFMAAFSEELFFRGVLQKVLNEFTGNKHLGVWIGAILFSAFHMQFFGFLPRMLMGAYLGYLFLWSGSIWPSVFAHFTNNGMAVFLIWLSNRGTINVEADKVGINESEWIYVVISCIMVIMSLFLVYKAEKKRNLPVN